MSKEERANRAAYNSATYKAKHSYYRADSQNKRVYQMEKNIMPKPMSEMQKVKLVHNDNVSASSIYKLEQFLKGIAHKDVKTISPSERKRIVKEYGLRLNDSGNQWTASKKDVFEILKANFSNANYYANYSELWGSFRNLQPLRTGI